MILSNHLPTVVFLSQFVAELSRLNKRKIQKYHQVLSTVRNRGIWQWYWYNIVRKLLYTYDVRTAKMRIGLQWNLKLFTIVGCGNGGRDGRIKLAESELLCLKWRKLGKAASMVQYIGVKVVPIQKPKNKIYLIDPNRSQSFSFFVVEFSKDAVPSVLAGQRLRVGLCEAYESCSSVGARENRTELPEYIYIAVCSG